MRILTELERRGIRVTHESQFYDLAELYTLYTLHILNSC